MSRVNDVKKILRDRGVEMDADDVLAVLHAQPRYRVGLGRSHVSTSLAELHATDPDIVRTRRGLYRYYEAPTPAAVPQPPPPRTERPREAPLPPAEHVVPPSLAPTNGVVLIVDLDYARTVITSQLGGATIDDDTLARHLARLGRRSLGADPLTISCPTATATLAAVGDALDNTTPIVLTADRSTTTAAQQLAAQLDRTVTPLRLPEPPPRRPATSVAMTPPMTETSSADDPAPEARTKTQAAANRLYPLSDIDHDGFHRPLHLTAAPRDENGRRRSARRIGDSYAARWWNVANDDMRDHLLTWGERKADPPDDLLLDLLLFAERNGLADADALDHHICCGFWTAIRERRPFHAADVSATS